MISLRQLLSTTLSVAVLCGSAAAQSAANTTQSPADAKSADTKSSAPAVTASVSESGVRFAAPGEVLQVRLQIYAAAGELVFDSGARAGGVIDWKAADVQQGLADGAYLCVVTVKDLHNRQTQKLAALSVESGKVSLAGAKEDELTAAQLKSVAAARQALRVDAGEAASALTVMREGKERAVTVTSHDGRVGEVTSTTGGLSFRTGDFFAGTETERMRITPDGRVGIGTSDPQATLDVAGTVRARGGIVFDDGTVLKSARGAASRGGAAMVVGDVTPNVAGTGTSNQLVKWTDNAGTLGNSSITEVGGKIGIGTTTPDSRFTIEGAVPSLNGFMSVIRTTGSVNGYGLVLDAAGSGNNNFGFAVSGAYKGGFSWDNPRGFIGFFNGIYSNQDFSLRVNSDGSLTYHDGASYPAPERFRITAGGNVGIGTPAPTQKLDVVGNIKLTGAGSALIFPDGSSMTTAATGGGGTPSGTSIVNAINDAATVGTIGDNRHSPNIARMNGQNNWTGQNTFNGLSMNGTNIVNVANPVSATDATNKAYTDANFVKFVPGAEQLSVGDANGTAPMINLRGGSTCCSGPGGHTPAWFKVFQNGSFVATGNLGIGVSPMQGKGYRTSWDSYKGAFRSGYADAEWDDANVGFFSWAGGSNSTAIGLYALAFGDTNSAESTSSIVFGSGNQVKGAAGFSAGAGNRVCDTYGVAFGNKAQSGGPLINGKCDPDSFNLRGLAAIAMGYNVTADQDHTMAFGKFASNNGFTGTFVWSDGSATASADTFRNTANNEFAARATGGFRFRTNLAGTTGCNLPAGSGVFNCTSSRTTKENFREVSGSDVLARVRKMPVSTWNYIDEGRQVRHMGPMAEDFYQTFGLGTNNISIGVQDLAGVSLAAVKALEARTANLQQSNAQLSATLQQKTAEVAQLRTALDGMEQRLAALERNAQPRAASHARRARR
jgi:uncharacterized coiled-coil protein SlyX